MATTATAATTAFQGQLLTVMKEAGVSDLPNLAVKGAFARALVLEYEAGHTTPEAEEYLNKAVAAEAAYYAA